MNTSDTHITDLYTGNAELDTRLQVAYELGLKHGPSIDRENLKRNTEIRTTEVLLAALMRSQHVDLQTAMVTLSIPRKERKTYVKIFAAKERQKKAR